MGCRSGEGLFFLLNIGFLVVDRLCAESEFMCGSVGVKARKGKMLEMGERCWMWMNRVRTFTVTDTIGRRRSSKIIDISHYSMSAQQFYQIVKRATNTLSTQRSVKPTWLRLKCFQPAGVNSFIPCDVVCAYIYKPDFMFLSSSHKPPPLFPDLHPFLQSPIHYSM